MKRKTKVYVYTEIFHFSISFWLVGQVVKYGDGGIYNTIVLFDFWLILLALTANVQTGAWEISTSSSLPPQQHTDSCTKLTHDHTSETKPCPTTEDDDQIGEDFFSVADRSTVGMNKMFTGAIIPAVKMSVSLLRHPTDQLPVPNGGPQCLSWSSGPSDSTSTF